MNTQDFDELAGRIEGIGRAVLLLTAVMEQNGVISGPRYCDALRASRLDGQNPVLAVAQQTLQELAQAMDDARMRRQSLAH